MENKIKICMIIMFIMMATTISVGAATLIKSSDVVYDNTISGIEATTVQGAVDELYTAATDYSTLSNKVNSLKTEIIDAIYPKGSIYMSTEDDTVAKVEAKFGGAWERYSEGRTLIGIGTSTDSNGNISTYSSISNGGSSQVVLDITNLPSHNHSFEYSKSATSTQNHTLTVSEMPRHTHYQSMYVSSSSYHIPGSFNVIKGEVEFAVENPPYLTSMITGATGSDAGHSHNITLTNTSSNTSNTGSGNAINVQNPYTTIYMYKRLR